MGGLMAGKPKIERAVRLRAVEMLYLKRNGPTRIHEMIGKKFGVALHTIEKDVMEVRASWGKKLQELEAYGDYADEFIERSRQVQSKAEDAGDYALVYRIEKDLAGLLGVDIVTPIFRTADVSSVGDVPVEALDGELDEVARLLAEAGVEE